MKFRMFTILFTFLLCSLNSAEQKLIVMRHGEAENNVQNVYNSSPTSPHYRVMSLTEKGKHQVQETAAKLKGKGFNNQNIEAVYVSPLPRTRQTAELLAETGLFSKDKIIVDGRLAETQAGELEGKPQVPSMSPATSSQFNFESDTQMKARLQSFYQALLQKHQKGHVLAISHALPSKKLIEIVSEKKANFALGEAMIIPLRK